MQTCFPCSAEKDNCSLLISNSSFPQGRINPPIRGSIEIVDEVWAEVKYLSQSPYKGFNSGMGYMGCKRLCSVSIPL